MEMIRIAIVDDEEEESRKLEECFRQLGREMKKQLEIKTFSSAINFLEEKAPFDLVCLDIEMPEMDGLELASRIRETDDKVMIIFVTNLAQMAIRGYEVRARDFLLKPIHYYSFSMKLGNALKALDKRESRNLAVLTADGIKRISTTELYYVEVQGHYLYYHTVKSVFRQKASLKDLEDKLVGLPFTKCNQCYLVNLQYAMAVSHDMVQAGEDWLKISRPQKKRFLAELAAYIGGSAS